MFENFQLKNNNVTNEGDVIRDIVPIMCGDANFVSRQNLLFTQLDPITNNTTVHAKRDFYDGACLKNIDKQVQEELEEYIIPTTYTKAPLVPNFFLEVKSPSGGMDVAERQDCYNGALGSRGMHQLQSYKQHEPGYDGNAYTITTTHLGGILKMYTTHPTQAEDGTTEYKMYQIGGWDTLGDPDSCRRGFATFRQSRDWAQEQPGCIHLSCE